ncbi:MAG: hypothetical protein F4219_02265 [Gammaproteobacteria bacterium]|nr:hypothetical protein [Gammaproteobacteria bacterium]
MISASLVFNAAVTEKIWLSSTESQLELNEYKIWINRDFIRMAREELTRTEKNLDMVLLLTSIMLTDESEKSTSHLILQISALVLQIANSIDSSESIENDKVVVDIDSLVSILEEDGYSGLFKLVLDLRLQAAQETEQRVGELIEEIKEIQANQYSVRSWRTNFRMISVIFLGIGIWLVVLKDIWLLKESRSGEHNLRREEE